jgi:hypothetical protein
VGKDSYILKEHTASIHRVKMLLYVPLSLTLVIWFVFSFAARFGLSCPSYSLAGSARTGHTEGSARQCQKFLPYCKSKKGSFISTFQLYIKTSTN